jgi:GT2 family glycosyltransferase
MSKIGIVTVTFNSAPVLPGFVECLRSQDHQDFVLYVIDNRSADGSADRAEQLCREQGIAHRIQRNDENVGVARANNQGIRMALEDGCAAIIVANNDVEFPRDTLSRIDAIRRDRPRDMIAPKVVFHDSPHLIWSAGGRVSAIRGVPRTRGYRRHDGAEYSAQVYTQHAATCFLVVPAEVFRRAGLMDEDFFVYLDDSDFVVRAMRAGYRILYVPDPVILHKVSSSTGGADSPFTVHQIAKNTILFLHKNNSPVIAAWYILLFLGRSSLRLLRYDRSRREKIYQGVREGIRFVIEHRTAKRNAPAVEG